MTFEALKKAYEISMRKCSELESEKAEWESKKAELEQTVQELRKTNEDHQLEIEHLTELLLKRNQMLFGKKSEKEKHLGLDGQMTLDGDVVLNEAEEQSDDTAEEPTEENVTKEKKKHPHRGRKLHDDLPRKKITFELPEQECNCPVCAGKLRKLAPEHLTSRLAVVPSKAYMIDYERMVYMCPACEKNGEKGVVAAAPNQTPPSVVPKGLADASVIADIIQRKYQLGMPLYRQEQYWSAQGIYLNRTAMANWVIAAGKWLEPITAYLWKKAYAKPVLHADETPLRVLTIQGKKTDKKCQMWVCVTGEKANRKIALYTFRDSRSKQTAEEMFAEYTGILQTDGLQSYGSGKYTNAGCWAHARRKFVDSIPKGNKKCKAAQVVLMIDRMMHLEKEAREQKYDDEKLLEMRRTKIAPIAEEFYAYLDTLHPGKGTHLYTAITYARNQKTKLLVFLEHAQAEMTNNAAERTVKPFVINRKNFLFSDTEKGAAASGIVMSIIETAKRNQLDVYGYLMYLLRKLPEIGKDPEEKQIEPLMPWSISLPGYCKAAYHEMISDSCKI